MHFVCFTGRTLVHCNTSSDICVCILHYCMLMLCWSIKEKLQEEIGCECLLPAVLIGSGLPVDKQLQELLQRFVHFLILFTRHLSSKKCSMWDGMVDNIVTMAAHKSAIVL